MQTHGIDVGVNDPNFGGHQGKTQCAVIKFVIETKNEWFLAGEMNEIFIRYER